MAGTEEDTGGVPLLKNRYQLGKVLGRGGMCIVYQAWDTRRERFVAIKRLEPPLNEDPRTRARFDREGRALALLDHPNLVALLDRGSTDNDDYLVFEYVDGRSLKELIREGHIGLDVFGLLVGQVAEGLASAHKAGIVHRDVKPQNILIDRKGHAKVSDFGIAISPDWSRVTRAGAVIGSARYMSPEQIRSKPVDARSDIYSLGIVMYEMLTGHTPFDGNNMPEIARQHLQATPPPLTDARTQLPPGLDSVVLRCLEKDPEDRFESMGELITALRGLGLYQAHEEVADTGTHRWSLRRSQPQEEAEMGPLIEGSGHAEAEAPPERPSRERPSRERPSSAREPASEAGGDQRWMREQAREVARKRRLALRRRIMALGAVVVLLVLIIVPIATCGPGKAPDVVGMTRETAEEEAARAGLDPVVTEIPSVEIEPGIVLDQYPLAGFESEDGTLSITVSKIAEKVEFVYLGVDDTQGDGRENDGQVPNLTDGNPNTYWTTELTYKSPVFEGLGEKKGVGLGFVLAEEATMLRMEYVLTDWRGELQTVTTAGGMYVNVADLGNAKQVTWTEPVKNGRIWLTQLADLPDSDRYGMAFSEIAFYK